MLERESATREFSPTGGVLKSQTAKVPFAPPRGHDRGKWMVRRKRHLTVDADGEFLMLNRTPADVSDRAGATTIRRRHRPYPTDLSAAHSAAFAELVPELRPDGRPRRIFSHEQLCAMLYSLRGGQVWRLL